MSMNSYMHPRNPYRNPPDFAQLAVHYPEIRECGTLDVTGKVRLNCHQPSTLRALTTCLLHRDFSLRVHLPPDKLVPTLPLRLNYILWLEDIIAATVASPATNLLQPQITGIDIGCGASCIYPLLATSRNPNWRMYGLETNAASAQHARSNCAANSLQHRIAIIEPPPSPDTSHPSNELRIFDALLQTDEVRAASATSRLADFCMCNPPFFAADSANGGAPLAPANRTGRRPAAGPHRRLSVDEPSPPAASIGSLHELAVAGGELAFAAAIVKESAELRQRIRVYTTMLGCKSSVAPVRRLLAAAGVRNVAETEFCQGRTTRWGVAWSWDEAVPLARVPACGPAAERRRGRRAGEKGEKAAEQRKPLRPLAIEGAGLGAVVARLGAILGGIGLEMESDAESGGLYNPPTASAVWTGACSALHDSWSNQRRRRREAERLAAAAAAAAASAATIHEAMDEDDEPEQRPTANGDPQRGRKRLPEADATEAGFYDDERVLGGERQPAAKRSRLAETQMEEENGNGDAQSMSSGSAGGGSVAGDAFLRVKLRIEVDESRAQGFRLHVSYVDGSAGRDGATQLAQFIQNRWQ